MPLRLLGKLFESMGDDMSKVIVEVGYRSYVLDAKDALTMAEIFGKAERYEAKWHSKTDKMESHHTYHIYTEHAPDAPSMKILNDATYQMYKLAGKPEGD
jgi:hypothetical protein